MFDSNKEFFVNPAPTTVTCHIIRLGQKRTWGGTVHNRDRPIYRPTDIIGRYRPPIFDFEYRYRFQKNDIGRSL